MIDALEGRSARRSPPLIVLVPALVVGAGMLLPLTYLIARAFQADAATVVDLVLRPRTFDLLVNTAALTGGVLVLSTLIALPLAWLTTRSDLGGRKTLTVLLALPLAVPGYVMAYALIGLSGNYGFMMEVFGIRFPRPEGWWGATLALTLYTYPYLFLNLRAAFSGMDASFEDSARVLGHGPWAVFRKVTLPHLRPALFAGWLVIGLYVIGDFGAVALMRYEVFSYALYIQYTAAFDRLYAAWLALILIAIAISVVWWEGRVRDGSHYARSGSGTARPATVVRLGLWRYPAWGFATLVVAGGLGLPIAVLAFWLGKGPLLPALPALAAAFKDSLSVALPAALLATALAVPVAIMTVRYPSGLSRFIDRLAFVGYAVPPLALGLAFVFFALHTAQFLYQSLTLLIIVYALGFLALSLGPVRASLYRARPSLEQAARTLGYSPPAVFAHINLPLMRRGLIASVTLVFMIAMKELPLAFLLAPTGFRSLAITVFSRTSEGMLVAAAPYAAAIIAFSGLFLAISIRFERKSW